MIKFVLVLLLIICTVYSQPVTSQIGYNIDKNDITISGLSSGGYMSVQLQVAFSEQIKRAAIVAAGPYWNGKGDAQFAQRSCRQEPDLINLEDLKNHMVLQEQQEKIDSLQNLKKSKILALINGRDTTVVPQVSEKMIEQYEYFGAQVVKEVVDNCEHAFPTTSFGQTDPLFKGSPFINICNFDGAKSIFENIVLKEGEQLQQGSKIEQNFYKFEQKPYLYENSHMHDYGYLYVPSNCKNKQKQCRLHVAFHGCRQNPEYIGQTFAYNAGYNEHAEANDVIIYYPQTKIDSEKNPNACWDYWGYSGENYANNEGSQMQSVMNVVKNLIDEQEQKQTKNEDL